MGDLYYIVGDLSDKWEYVCYGKQSETYSNHKDLLAAFMFLEKCIEFYYPVRLIKSGASLEYHAMKHFKASVADWPNFVKDVSDEYLEYVEEELID